jgi:hypothetical protein
MNPQDYSRDNPGNHSDNILCYCRVHHLRQHKTGSGSEEGPEDLSCLLVLTERIQYGVRIRFHGVPDQPWQEDEERKEQDCSPMNASGSAVMPANQPGQTA